MTSRPPNILFICSDQEVAHLDLPADIDLPGHDRLRQGGTTFTNFHVTTAPCTPSRAVIYTGQHAQATRVITNTGIGRHAGLSPDTPTFGHLLRDRGYYTAYKGKWHLGGADTPELTHPLLWPSTEDVLEPYGFSDYTVEGDHWGRAWEGLRWDRSTAADSAAWLQTKGKALADEAQPWCLSINFINPHDIMFYLADERQHQRRLHYSLGSPLKTDPPGAPYDKFWDVELPRNFADNLNNKPWCHRNFQLFWQHFLGAIDLDDHDAWRRFRSYYYNCIRDVDRQLQVVLDALADSGQADRTAIVYTSDHGELAGAHGLREKGANMYRENLRVPFIVNHPDQLEVRETDALGASLDIVPTLLSIAGASSDEVAEKHPELRGEDLTPTIRGGKTDRDENGILFYYSVLVGSYDADKFREVMLKTLAGDPPPPPTDGGPIQPWDDRALFRGIHTGRHKFARYFAPAEHHVPTDWDTLSRHNDLELYDIESDPDELDNLANRPEEHRDLMMSLNEQLNSLIAAEVGTDDGRELPGPISLHTLKA